MYTQIPVYENYLDRFTGPRHLGDQRHHEEVYSDAGTSFYAYDDAYQYGYKLASEHQDRDWEDVVDKAEAYWTRDYGDTPWDDVKDAVEHAWSEVTRSIGGE